MKGFSRKAQAALFAAGLALSPLARALDLADVETIVRAQATTSVEAFLDGVDARDRAYLRYFTLFRETRSLQGATSTYPRAVAYGGEAAGLVMTFNGLASLAGYDDVELLRFVRPRPDTYAGVFFDFREVHFSGGEHPALSPSTPAKCLRCHYIPARPIWDDYDEWTGAYGFKDDGILDFSSGKYLGTDPSEAERERYKEELAAYQKFQEIALDHPRYSRLRFPLGSAVSPYSPRHRGDNRFRTNSRLTHALANQNAQALMSLLTRDEACFAGYGPLLAAVLAGCRTVPAFAPDPEAPDDPERYRSFPKYEARFAKLLPLIEAEARRKFQGFVPTPWNKKYGERRDPLLESLLPLMGVEHTDWNMSRVPDRWNYYEGGKYMDEILHEHVYPLAARATKDVPAWQSIATYNVEPSSEDERLERAKALPAWWAANPLYKACDELLGAFESRFEKARARNTCLAPPAESGKPLVVQMCASCHDGSTSGAPVIPFGDEGLTADREAWGARIRDRIFAADPARRMPPERPLAWREKETLKRYLEASPKR